MLSVIGASMFDYKNKHLIIEFVLGHSRLPGYIVY